MNTINVIIDKGKIDIDTDAEVIPKSVVVKLVNELFKDFTNNFTKDTNKIANTELIKDLNFKCKFYKALALISNIVLLGYAILNIIRR